MGSGSFLPHHTTFTTLLNERRFDNSVMESYSSLRSDTGCAHPAISSGVALSGKVHDSNLTTINAIVVDKHEFIVCSADHAALPANHSNIPEADDPHGPTTQIEEMCPSGGEQNKCTASECDMTTGSSSFTKLLSQHSLAQLCHRSLTKEKGEEYIEFLQISKDVDDMLSHAGDFGRYQILLMALFCIINVLSSFHYFGQTIISVVPEHRCRDADPLMSLQEAEINISGCVSGWDYNLTDGFQSIISEASHFPICFCRQFDWVGDDDWKPALGQSLFFVGSVLGTLGLGVMADHIGRLPVLVLANLLALVGNLATAFSSGLPQFASCRFLAGLATDSNFLMMYILVGESNNWRFRKPRFPRALRLLREALVNSVTQSNLTLLPYHLAHARAGLRGGGPNQVRTIAIDLTHSYQPTPFCLPEPPPTSCDPLGDLNQSVMEYMRPNMRTLGLNLCIGVFYSLGCVVVPWVAVLTRDWRHFLLVVSTPLVVVPAYYLLVPESARWLINKGRTDEAITCFLRIAKFNGCISLGGQKFPTGEIACSDPVKMCSTHMSTAPAVMFPPGDMQLAVQTVHSTRKVSDKSPTLLGLFATPRLRRKTCILIFKS
uniref:(California timema) hypothetical protein n=1 Tax=Timema californicum TaxID=61474 RepID=A0A7R9J5Y2_TIMCA|nr:unnamed protein product [Timema californicum]